MELILAILFVVLFFRVLGLLLRAGFKVLGFVFGLIGACVLFALAIAFIGLFWWILPVLLIVGIIRMAAGPKVI